MARPSEIELALLGGAIYAAQRVEFALYGLAAHASHLEVAKKDGRFRNLTPEKFLRGDVSELKATLGQIVETFGDAFMIKSEELVTFYKDRNLIAHNFYRTYYMSKDKTVDPSDFLLEFIRRANVWEKIIRGLLSIWIEAVAKQANRLHELVSPPNDDEHRAAYYSHVMTRFAATKGA